MIADTKHILLLGYHGLQTLDLSGPLDAFASANEQRPGSYRVTVASLDGQAFTSEAGLTIMPERALSECGAIDSLLLPGGAGLRQPDIALAVSAALRELAPRCRRMVSICTGLYGIAAAGLADGKRATTHWRHAADLGRRFPAIRLEPDAIFVKDDGLYSSAGITAAIDLALVLIEEDLGSRIALAVARDLVVYLRRSGGQRQYSEPLRFQAQAGDRLTDLAQWIADHLHEELSLDRLAEQACLSPRQLSRRFKRQFGASAAQAVENLRLDSARDHLLATAMPIAAIAALVGFRSDDAFRRAFHRHYGLAPLDYRQRFTRYGDQNAA
jgi:transcriptional regulator GlxA family with amidase domain